uniref:Uncharacterized protein n=1 Tax=Eucampia antarctica TaxID=49252 RepID=A0A6U0SEZ5_9STRA|mmetsp:Transcript_27003/g.25863  ORF Transcript_27003/g.25863 Transcript_27003/m.25863 type:complete len:112 (+) Transcript_27003:647-982(+)
MKRKMSRLTPSSLFIVSLLPCYYYCCCLWMMMVPEGNAFVMSSHLSYSTLSREEGGGGLLSRHTYYQKMTLSLEEEQEQTEMQQCIQSLSLEEADETRRELVANLFASKLN